MARRHQHTDDNNDGGLRAVKLSRLTKRGVILGLSLPQVITLAAGLASVVAALYLGGGILLAYTAPVWILCAALTWVPVGGPKLIDWVPIAARWAWRSTGGQLLYGRGIIKAPPAATPALPGAAGALRPP